jgi:regulator of sigma D
MFGFFRKKKKVTVSKGTAPGTQIHYHSDLVPELHEDHQQLLKLFGEIDKANQKRDHARLSRLIDEFGVLLRGHLLTENVKLYVYLQHTLANDPDNSALMQGFRTEMHSISKVVTKFLRQYSKGEWNDQRHARFAKELNRIGEVLVKRIETEEQVLYPLYMPPESYL